MAEYVLSLSSSVSPFCIIVKQSPVISFHLSAVPRVSLKANDSLEVRSSQSEPKQQQQNPLSQSLMERTVMPEKDTLPPMGHQT